MKLLNTLTFVFVFVGSLNGSKILVLTPLGSKSHKNFFRGIGEVLAKREHQVTLVSVYKDKKAVANLRDLVLPGPFVDEVLIDVFTKGPNSVIQNLLGKTPALCSESMSYAKEVGLHKENYDLIIMSMFMNFCYLTLVHEMKVPFIYAWPASLDGPYSYMAGNVEFTSFLPNLYMSAVYPLSFMERVQSAVSDIALIVTLKYYNEPAVARVCIEQGLCPTDLPPLSHFHENVSLVFDNSITTLNVPPRPTMPHIISVGGLHCQEGKPLPKDLEDFIQSSGDDGFIFFSMGSALTPSLLPERHRKSLINAFASLKQKVIFKWDKPTMPDLPPNVKLWSWLPQQDLLAHPKLKVFVTHGGLNSAMEASYHGIPLIGIPIFADQEKNMNTAELQGWARRISWPELDEVKLSKLIKEVIGNEKMRETVRARSVLMKDRRNPPEEDVIFWTEYVLRHKGADHLKSPIRKFSWITLYNVDVYFTLISVLIALLTLAICVPYLLYRRCCTSRSTSKFVHGKTKYQ